MYLRCPKCQSDSVRIRNLAKKTCAILGTVAGAIAAAIASTQTRWLAPVHRVTPRDDFGRTANRTANTLLSALVGASTGGATGAKLGGFLDDHILNNYQCRRCKHKFSADAGVFQEDDDFQDAWAHGVFPGTQMEVRHQAGSPASEGKDQRHDDEA